MLIRVCWCGILVNPYGDKVEMKLYSVPSSGVVLEKVIGRVGGYSLQNEVYTPVVEFRQGSANNLYRVTAVLTNYSGQEQYVTSTVPVSGTGNALKVMSTKNTDYVYAGSWCFPFATYTTNANTTYIRTNSGLPKEYTIINGTYLNYGELGIGQYDQYGQLLHINQ